MEREGWEQGGDKEMALDESSDVLALRQACAQRLRDQHKHVWIDKIGGGGGGRELNLD